ncbi:outer membrane beta-barrel protein [Sphingobacterium faecale]|uniref:Outer membrane beta-barrel protein n=1 Tax=Sphingobacterium faecale TaxID=2803775 RepID=A0ABS1R6G8_9SPHI|nr:outer membrane beta-barrel protein [Sphingobacterium faecale]MBL1410253.1 outer membrane beta-barrel protein [Sphingobacterium faecale]
MISFLIVLQATYAQNQLSGNIVDKTTSKPLSGVTLRLMNKKDSSTITLSSNINGLFSQAELKKGDYTISTNYLGFKPESRAITMESKPVYLFFRLEPSEIAIEEVEIMASPAIVLKGDTMEFDAKNFSTREYADADELVAQIPGVMIDEEGNVEAHGEKVTRVIVDGKEFFSSDPRIALKNLPAEIIAKIQLIDEKSEQARFSGFDDGKRNKVINIVTKADKRHGYFGKASGGKGDGDKFGINSSINAFAGDKKYAINLMANNINETNFAEQGRGGGRRGNNNTERGLSDTYAGAINFTNTYLDKKMEVSADYNFKSLSTVTNTLSNIEYLNEKQANQFRTQEQLSDNLSKEHKFNGRIKWNIDSTNRIDFSPNISYTQGVRANSSNSETNRGRTELINHSIRSNDNDSKNFNIGGALTYMHRFKKKGRSLSLNVTGNKSSNDALGLNLATTSYYKNSGLNRIDTNNNQSLTEGYGSGLNSRLSFTESISEYSRLQANYSFRNTANYSNRETFEFLAETGQLGKLKDRLSNEFRNDYNYHSGGLSYSFNKKDVLRIQAGLNYQHGIRINNRTVPIDLKTKADFSSLLPEFTTVYKFSKDRNLEFNYNTQTNTPNINQLQDFINDGNELRITNGNPNLDQEYAHTLRLQYKDVNKLTGRTLTTNMSFEYINDKIINSVLMTDKDTTLIFKDSEVILGAGGQYSAPINVNGAYNFRINNSYGLPIKPLKINIHSNTRLFFDNDLAETNGNLVRSRSYGFGQSIGINSNFSKLYVVGLSYNINGRYTHNPISRVPRYEVFTHRINNNITVELFKKLVLSSQFMYLLNGGIMGSPGIETTLWNASVGYKLLKRKNGELALKGFDLLNNAQNVNRRVNENNISDVTSNTLNRYFLLSFTYNLRQFGGKVMGGRDIKQRGPRHE